MTRASAANGDICPEGPVRALGAEAALRLAAAGVRRPIEALKRAHRRFLAAVSWRVIPPAASIGAAFAIIGIIALTLYHLRLEHDLALRAAVHEVDMRATLLVPQLNAALIADPKGSEAEIFRSVLEAHPDERLAQSILIDRDGRLVEFERMQSCDQFAAGDPFRRAKCLSAGDWGGVVGFKLRAATNNLRPFGRFRTSAKVAFASPVDLHLAAWRRTALVTVFLLA